MNIEQQIGYLVAKAEELSNDSKTQTAKLEALEKRVDEKFKTVEATFRVLKWLGMFLAAVLTLKFGDLPALWKSLF